VSAASNPYLDSKLSEQKIEQIRRQINRLFDEVAQLTEQDLAPAAFHAEFLQRALTGVAAPAGAVWGRSPEGNLVLQYQINLPHVGLDQSQESRQAHDEFLRQTCLQGKPQYMLPRSGGAVGGAGNPTDFIVLIAPIVLNNAVVGLLEVWQDPRHSPDALPGFLQFLIKMAGLASLFVRNQHLRQLSGQQQVWEELEKFSRKIHSSLNPTEVAYLIANEGRRLVICDRVSVAVREGRKTRIEAISGADVVEKRSNLVQLQCALADQVAKWGERLVYQGTKDDSLPPPVLAALDSYLAESNSKLLVVLPLRDEREKNLEKPPRSTLLMESFETGASNDQLFARLEVISRHATSALYNAVEHRRIPLRILWQPLARLQDGLGSKARAITAAVGGLLLVTLILLIVIPYPMKMDANGKLLPEGRVWMYAPVEGQIVSFPEYVFTGSTVFQGQTLIEMRDQRLEAQVIQLKGEIATLVEEIKSLESLFVTTRAVDDKQRITGELRKSKVQLDRKKSEYDALIRRTDAIEDRPGYFLIRAPIGGTVLNSDFRETLINRTVKPSEPLLRIGDKDKGWEIDLKIPQRHIGQILLAFEGKPEGYELDVDLLLASAPTKTYKGKLARGKIAGEALPNRDDPNDSEPVVAASVRIDGPGIAASEKLPPDLLVTGTVVHAKVRCGNKPMIYSLFYGVWEFIYEKFVFWF